MRTKSRAFLICLIFSASVAWGSDVRDRKIYDEDGDRIFENLRARIDRSQKNERLPVLIQFREDTPLAGTYAARISSILQSRNLRYSYRNFPVVAASLTPVEIRQALRDPMVEHVEWDGVIRKTMTTASQSFGVTQARMQFGFTGDGDGKPGSYGTQDVVISIIDTGVHAAHPDLRGKVLYFKDYVNGRTTPYDDEGHGTHVAGVAAGAGKAKKDLAGVAPGAALVVFKVLGADGSGSLSDGIAAVDETISLKTQFNIRILNLSLAVTGSSNGRDAFSLACDRAVSRGIVTVVAAGNEGSNARTIGSPSAAARVITVGAGADAGERGFYVASFSSRGPTADGRIKPDLWAPGVKLRSPQNTGGYSDVSGTSFATPFVSGVAALMINARPAIKPGAVKAILIATADRWAPGGKNNEFGAGRLQAYQAVARAASISDPPEPPDVPRVKFLRSFIDSSAPQMIHFRVLSTRFPVAITAVMLNYPSTNLEIQVLSPSGSVVARSNSGSRQETARFLPTVAGQYTVQLTEAFGSTPFILDIAGDIQ